MQSPLPQISSAQLSPSPLSSPPPSDRPAAHPLTAPQASPDNAPPPLRRCPVHNRLAAAMVHVNWYLFSPQARLARDAAVSRSALCRVLSGQAAPSFALIWKVTKALERRLGPRLPHGRLDPCELFSLDGAYPTPSVCALVGCPGCRMAEAQRQERATRADGMARHRTDA